MNFATPLWLLFIPVVLILPWLRSSESMPFSSLGLLGSKETVRMRLARLLPVLASLGATFLVIALARPVEEFREQIMEKEGIDIMLVVDTSGSMEAEDFRLNGLRISRMMATKRVLESFVDQRPNDRLGLVLFGEEAYTYVPLTLDHSGMINFLRNVSIGLAGDQATAIGDGIAIAAQRLRKSTADSRIAIVLTDGQSNAGVDPVQAGEAAAELGLRVYTIGIGDDSRSGFGFFSRSAGLDEETLKAVAEGSGGQYFRAKDTDRLEEVYVEIDRLEPTTAEFTEYIHREERAWIWVMISAFFFVAFTFLSESWLRRIP